MPILPHVPSGFFKAEARAHVHVCHRLSSFIIVLEFMHAAVPLQGHTE